MSEEAKWLLSNVLPNSHMENKQHLIENPVPERLKKKKINSFDCILTSVIPDLKKQGFFKGI